MYNRKYVFWAACFGMLLFGISLITLGAVAPDLRAKFELDEIAAGTLFSILPVGILAGSLVFGPLCDRHGYKIFLIFSCLCLFAGLLGMVQTNSLLLLKVCVFVFGFGGGAINGAASAVVSDISEHKRSGLSLLGVFFAVGALAMPIILAQLQHRYPFQTIVSAVSLLTLAAALFYAVIQFPPAKQKQGVQLSQSLRLLNDGVLVLIAFFLFCQSSFEGIINNWTTTYLLDQLSVQPSAALYALSLYVAGMAVMRLLIGSVLGQLTAAQLLTISFAALLAGCLLLTMQVSFTAAAAGLVLMGAGLAAGFPLMLGIVGSRYSQLSATAFSFVLVVALLGNMLVNLLMGYVAQAYGVQHLTTVALTQWGIMIVLAILIIRKLKTSS